MPTATEALTRRAALALGLGLAAGGARARGGGDAVLCAAWSDATGGSRVGLLRLRAQHGAAQVIASVAVPTRAHGVLMRADGSVLAVARRPGDWLLHWQPQRRRHTLHWNDGARRFNGHAVEHAGRLYTTETDLADGQGCIAVRETRTWRELALWPTHGRDPHDLLLDTQQRVWVANGGIATDPATGRAKDVRMMDSSLVCLDAHDGTLRGQWRLTDERLSLRHLAQRSDGAIGVALQAEHDDAPAREAAPLLAVWQSGHLRTIDGPALRGYGGDIAVRGDAFVVSAPRADRVVAWHAERGWRDAAALAQACALAPSPAGVWCGGLDGVACEPGPARRWTLQEGERLDNHAAWAAPLPFADAA
jgi:uncharacterized protein